MSAQLMPATNFPPPVEAARKLAPMVRACADEIDKTRELPRPLFEAIADAGLFLTAIPRKLGGAEIDLPTHVKVIEEIGKADASTAWAVNQNSIFAMFASRMQPAAVRAIWMDTPRSAVSNSPAPTGQAIVVPGGFRVTAKQGFSTGCRHASWVAAHSQIIENGKPRLRNGKPEIRYCIVPKAQAQLHDTWNVRGMRGTGTHTFEVKDVFIPEEHSVIPGPGVPVVTGGVRYRIPQTLCFASGDAVVALAVARSCLEAFFELAGSKEPRHLVGLLRDQPISQMTVGQAEAAIRSGRAFLMESVEAIWDDATHKDAVSLEARIALRLATTHAIHLAAKAVESIYTACGGSAIFDGVLIQRHFQDIHVITQHLQGRLAHYEMVGKHQLGLAIDEARL